MEQASCFTWASSEAAGNSTNSRVSPIWMWKDTPEPGAGTWGSSGDGACSSKLPEGGGDPGPGEPGSPAGWEGAAAIGRGPGPAARRPPGIRLQEPEQGGSAPWIRGILLAGGRSAGIPGIREENPGRLRELEEVGPWEVREKESRGSDARPEIKGSQTIRKEKSNGLGGPAIGRFQEIRKENLGSRGHRDQKSPGSKGSLEKEGIGKGAGGAKNPVAVRRGSI